MRELHQRQAELVALMHEQRLKADEMLANLELLREARRALGFLPVTGTGKGRVHFTDDTASVSGGFSLRLWPDPGHGPYATAIDPKAKDTTWDWSKKTELLVWVKYRNPNLPGWQDVGPVVTLFGAEGKRVIRP